MLPVAVGADEATRRLERVDGLLLIGGGDLDPASYGAEPQAEVYGVFPESDAFELALARAAVVAGVPTLAVCRGIQVLNVALGGTLDQHITTRPGVVDHGVPGVGSASHPVRVLAGSRLAAAMGVDADPVACSSHHHQAVAKLGDGLVAVGWSSDGLVEAVEHVDGWVVGVQWHPEDTAADDPAQQGLFDALVGQAAAAAGA